MDQLLSSFSSVEVTAHPNTPHAEHPRFALYKPKLSGSSQEERRKTVLAARKGARYDLLSHLRNIEVTLDDKDSSSDDMDCDQGRRYYKRPKKYKDFLMLSEWLVDVPNDFATTYYTVPCPVGRRSLVVSGDGKTEAYAKSGYQVRRFPSLLPGGHRHNTNLGYALLDCIWSQCNNTFYIIDIMCWVNQPVIESDTTFRFEWLKARFLEVEGLKEVSKFNPIKFEVVPHYDSSPESLTRLFSGDTMPFSVELDGILFYNKDTHYTHGPTPLVGWLKAYMLPEILGIEVGQKYAKERPVQYTNLPDLIQSSIANENKKKDKMEVTVSESTPDTTPKNEEEMESIVS